MRGKVCGQGQSLRPGVGGVRWGSGASRCNVGTVQMPHPGPASHLLSCSRRGVAGQDWEPRHRSVALEYCWTRGWKVWGKVCPG